MGSPGNRSLRAPCAAVLCGRTDTDGGPVGPAVKKKSPPAGRQPGQGKPRGDNRPRPACKPEAWREETHCGHSAAGIRNAHGCVASTQGGCTQGVDSVAVDRCNQRSQSRLTWQSVQPLTDFTTPTHRVTSGVRFMLRPATEPGGRHQPTLARWRASRRAEGRGG